MTLKGQARTDYMREYMRKRRAGVKPVNPEIDEARKPWEGIDPNNASPEALAAELWRSREYQRKIQLDAFKARIPDSLRLCEEEEMFAAEVARCWQNAGEDEESQDIALEAFWNVEDALKAMLGAAWPYEIVLRPETDVSPETDARMAELEARNAELKEANEKTERTIKALRTEIRNLKIANKSLSNDMHAFSDAKKRMTKENHRTILVALHPDGTTDPGLKRRLEKAFQTFTEHFPQPTSDL